MAYSYQGTLSVSDDGSSGLSGELNYGVQSLSPVSTSDYNTLTNKPRINNVELVGNVTTERLGIKNGEDGFSPVITERETELGYDITITDVEGSNTITLKNGTNGTNGTNGQDGKSAYEIAVDNGFVGTEQEWLESLKGQDGKDATVTVDNILSTTSENPVQNKVITEELNKKADQTTVDSALSLKANSADVTASLAGKSDIGHTHDDRYYTESETNTLLSDKVGVSDFNSHANNTTIHVTAEDKAAWNGKAELTDIPTTLPADGGNADTLDSKHASDVMVMGLSYSNRTKVTSSDNLDNYRTAGKFVVPDIATASSIGNSAFTDTGYFLDVWFRTNTMTIQIAMSWTGVIKIRNGTSATNWTAWRKINDGGDADTLDGLHANEIASNPNLLINPDFKINQAGTTSVTGGANKVYFADRWHSVGCSVTNTDGVVSAAWDGSYIYDNDKNMGYIQSVLELPKLIGKQVTLSIDIDDVRHHAVFTIPTTFPGIVQKTVIEDIDIAVGNYANMGIAFILFLKSTTSHIIGDAKLELGSIATPFTPPDPATELAKCQRYYQIRSTGNIAAVDLRPTMRDTPTITQLSDGNYAYSAEL